MLLEDSESISQEQVPFTILFMLILGSYQFYREARDKRQAAGWSSSKRLLEAICPMHILHDWRKENDLILFCSSKVPEYYLEKQVCRF